MEPASPGYQTERDVGYAEMASGARPVVSRAGAAGEACPRRAPPAAPRRPRRGAVHRRLQHVVDVRAHGVRRQGVLLGDLLAGQTLRQRPEHVDLARGQGRERVGRVLPGPPHVHEVVEDRPEEVRRDPAFPQATPTSTRGARPRRTGRASRGRRRGRRWRSGPGRASRSAPPPTGPGGPRRLVQGLLEARSTAPRWSSSTYLAERDGVPTQARSVCAATSSTSSRGRSSTSRASTQARSGCTRASRTGPGVTGPPHFEVDIAGPVVGVQRLLVDHDSLQA